MPEEVSLLIIKYGYLAFFILVLLSGIGIPIPILVEFVVIFAGYLVYTGLLKLIYILAVIITADSLSALIVYSIFYFFGSWILHSKTKWIKLPTKRIDKISAQVSAGGARAIYIVRITPFIRGYLSVVAGAIQIKPRVFLPAVLTTSVLWTGIYLLIGWLLAPYWSSVQNHFSDVKLVMLGATIIIIAVIAFRYFKNAARKKDSV